MSKAGRCGGHSGVDVNVRRHGARGLSAPYTPHCALSIVVASLLASPLTHPATLPAGIAVPSGVPPTRHPGRETGPQSRRVPDVGQLPKVSPPLIPPE